MPDVKQSPKKVHTHVTNRNGAVLAKLAREFGVSREEFVSFLKDKEKVGQFFQGLINSKWSFNLKSSANEINARVIIINRITVDNSVCLHFSKYHLLENEKFKTTETVILLNFPDGSGSLQRAQQFGDLNNLRRTKPAFLFATKEWYQKLNKKINLCPMRVIETTGCVSSGPCACSMELKENGFKPILNHQNDFSNNGDDWFIFCK